MTAETLDETVDQAADALPERRRGGKKLILYVILPLLVIAGGGAGLYVTGVASALWDQVMAGSGEEPAEAAPSEPGVFHDIPDILVNLDADARDPNYLKLSVSLELGSEADVARIEQVLPRINDNFQVYLRQMQLADLHGSAGLYRLKEELLRRIQTAAPDVDIRDVLVREMLVQ
jgi:flagellar FliL protein